MAVLRRERIRVPGIWDGEDQVGESIAPCVYVCVLCPRMRFI